MKTFYEGQAYEVYGEPTPNMIEDFSTQGLGLLEEWPGEVGSYFRANGREQSAVVGGAIVALCPQA